MGPWGHRTHKQQSVAPSQVLGISIGLSMRSKLSQGLLSSCWGERAKKCLSLPSLVSDVVTVGERASPACWVIFVIDSWLLLISSAPQSIFPIYNILASKLLHMI